MENKEFLETLKRELGMVKEEAEIEIKGKKFVFRPISQDELARIYTIMSKMQMEGEGWKILFHASIVSFSLVSIDSRPISEIFGENRLDLLDWLLTNTTPRFIYQLFKAYRNRWPDTLTQADSEIYVCPTCGWTTRKEGDRVPSFCVYDGTQLEENTPDPLA